LLVFGTSQISFGQNTALKIPVLNEHEFIPSTTVPDPFTQSHVLTSVGIGNTKVTELAQFDFLDEEGILVEGDLTNVLFDIGFQQRVRQWLALNVSISVAGRLGSDAFSLISSGVTAGTVTNIGWLVKPYQSSSSAIAVYLGAERATFTVVSPGQFLEDLFNGKPATFSDSIPSTQLESSVRMAHGFSRLVGAKIYGAVRYGEQTLSRNSRMSTNWKFGGSLSLDPWEQLRIPIGILASFTVSSFTGGLEDAKTKNREFELKVDYIVPDDYRFGLSFGWSSIPSVFEENFSVFAVQLTSRFYF